LRRPQRLLFFELTLPFGALSGVFLLPAFPVGEGLARTLNGPAFSSSRASRASSAAERAAAARSSAAFAFATAAAFSAAIRACYFWFCW